MYILYIICVPNNIICIIHYCFVVYYSLSGQFWTMLQQQAVLYALHILYFIAQHNKKKDTLKAVKIIEKDLTLHSILTLYFGLLVKM